MFKSAYETLACRSYNISDIKKYLNLARIDGTLLEARTPGKSKVIRDVFVVGPDNTEVPAFSHPFRLEDKDEVVYVIDGRPYLRKGIDGFTITNVSEYNQLLIRAALSKDWETTPNSLLSLGDLPIIVFSRWMSNAITSRLGLTPEDQVKLMVVTLFYWYSLFRNDEFDDKDKNNIARKISKISYIPTNITMGLIDTIGYMEDVNAYIDTVIKVVGSTRLEKLNAGLLFSMMGGSWFGLNSKEIIAVAIEHPPTFVSIIAAALESRSYRKSIIGRLVLDNDKKQLGKTFTHSLYSMLDE